MEIWSALLLARTRIFLDGYCCLKNSNREFLRVEMYGDVII